LLAQSRFFWILSLTRPRPVSATAFSESSAAAWRVAARIDSITRARSSSVPATSASCACRAAPTAASMSSKTPGRARVTAGARVRAGAAGRVSSSGASFATTFSTIASSSDGESWAIARYCFWKRSSPPIST